MQNKPTFGDKKNELKRVEIYLTNEVYNIMTVQGLKNGRLTKKEIELTVSKKALSLKGK